MLHLALVLQTLWLWLSEKHVLICRLSLFPGEILKGIWLIVVCYTNSNFGAQHPPSFASFNQSNIPFIPDKAYTIKTACLELHIMFVASKDLLFNKVLCFACRFLRNERFRVYKYRNFSLLSYDISCTSPAIQFTTKTYTEDNLWPVRHCCWERKRTSIVIFCFPKMSCLT